MSTNMTLIETKTIGAGGAASIDFTSIPQTYTDLVLKVSARASNASPWHGLAIKLNNSSASFSAKGLEGSGSAASSFNETTYIGNADGSTATANTFSNNELYFPNYTSSNFKSFSVDSVQEDNQTTAYATLMASLWSNTAAINQITLTPYSGTLLEYTTASLYGISNVTSTTKATGGIVSSDGTYNYHMFPYSGTYTPTTAHTADILVIAGGGAGGYSRGGGGGAGGLVYLTSQSLTAQGYTVTVGGGGAATTTDVKNDGSNSQFGSLTAAVGGGGGASVSTATGNNGGSGGGATSGGSVGTATSGQGSNGGSGSGTADSYGGGGGGGFSAAGGAGSGTKGGDGGNGTNTYSSWANATQTGADNGYYAGGGVGGTNNVVAPATAGLGGGGSQIADFGVAGKANTGGGGGSGMNSTRAAYGGAGGSGLVIIRYAI